MTKKKSISVVIKIKLAQEISVTLVDFESVTIKSLILFI